MISIPGSLSFAKLVMKSSAPAKSAGGVRYAIKEKAWAEEVLEHEDIKKIVSWCR